MTVRVQARERNGCIATSLTGAAKRGHPNALLLISTLIQPLRLTFAHVHQTGGDGCCHRGGDSGLRWIQNGDSGVVRGSGGTGCVARHQQGQDHGDAESPINELAITAIADLQQYWSGEYPKLYGQDYQPVSGGFYGMTPTVDGGFAVVAAPMPMSRANAFYCLGGRLGVLGRRRLDA